MADSPDVRAALHAALQDVRATLGALTLVADEQYAAAVEGDVQRVKALADRQEELAATLARAEKRRMAVVPGKSLRAHLDEVEHDGAGSSVEELAQDVARLVLALREQHLRNRMLLDRGAALANETVTLLRRLIVERVPDTPAMPARGYLVNGRA